MRRLAVLVGVTALVGMAVVGGVGCGGGSDSSTGRTYKDAAGNTCDEGDAHWGNEWPKGGLDVYAVWCPASYYALLRGTAPLPPSAAKKTAPPPPSVADKTRPSGASGATPAAGSAGSGQARWVIRDLCASEEYFGAALAINERGQVVGSCQTASGVDHAFLWQKGKMRDLGTLGGPYSEATAVNGSGQVVGWSDTAKETAYGYIRHAFLWQKGKMHDLGVVPVDRHHDGPESFSGGFGGFAAVNGSGQIVTWMGRTAFLWENGTMRDLGALPGGWESLLGNEQSRAGVINERGQVVGTARGATRRWHAVLWQGGRTIDLRIPPAGENSSAAAINNRGEIVGTRNGLRRRVFIWKAGRRTDLPVNAAPTATPGTPYAQDFSSLAINQRGDVAGTMGLPWTSNPMHAFLWKDGKVRVLGTLGGRYSVSAGLSDRGQVIGQSPTKDGRVHGFVWSAGRMSYLSALPGGMSSQARAINNRNQIVGWATDKAGQRHAVLWTLRNG